MTRLSRLFAFLGIGIACSSLVRAAAIGVFFEEFSSEWLRLDPQAATDKQYFPPAEQDALDRQLTPVSRAHELQRAALARRGLEQLREFPRDELTADERLSAAVLEWHLQSVVEAEPYLDFRFPLQQFHGVQNTIVMFLTRTHPIRNHRDAENYLARLAQVGGVIDDAVAESKSRAGRGIAPPRFILRATIDQIARFTAAEPETNPLVASFRDRLTAVRPAIDAGERDAMVARAASILREQIEPAYRRASDALQVQLEAATDDAGLWRLPGGDRAYARSLRFFTNTDLSADEIHALGRREVARIEREMHVIFDQLGIAPGTINQRKALLDAQQTYADGPDVRARVLADYERIMRDAERRCEAMFDLRPRAPVEVRRLPEFSEKNSAAHYTLPAPDGSRPGIFWMPLPGPTFERTDMRSLVYHETVPGHHFQLALQQEMKELPRFRRDGAFGFISAYGEGWALYAERLAAESGWYEDDLPGRIGQLASELFRARRLVVDTGLHAKRWTRQQAIDYGFAVNEVERYVVWPGQACSYKIGELRILDLRARAQRELGEKFSLPEFHNVVLRVACVPLPVLEQAIDAYIEKRRANDRSPTAR